MRHFIVVMLLLVCGVGNAGVAESTVQVAGFSYGVVMKGTGSGVCVQPGQVLTVNHVAQMGSSLKVRDNNGAWHNATVIKSGRPDWAVLSVPTLNVPALPVDRDGVRQNEIVTAYGRFPELRVNAGYIRDWKPFQGKMQHCTANVYPGFSGGPVVDAGGKVVGVVSMQTPGGSCLYVPVDQIR